MKRLLPLVALLVAGSAPAGAGTASWQGVVVSKDPARKAVATASAGGTVRTLRAPARFASLRVGQRLDVNARALADGTYASTSLRVRGRAAHARLRAVVVQYQRRAQRYIVSAGRSTFALRLARGRLLAAAEDVPATQPGTQITATVDVTGATPTTQQVTTVGRVGTLRIEGIVVEAGAGTLKLVVAKAGFVTVSVPSGLDVSSIKQFDPVTLQVAVGTDGSFTLLSARTDRSGTSGRGDHGNRGDEADDEDEDDD